MYEHVKTGCKHFPPSEQPLQFQSGFYLNKPRIDAQISWLINDKEISTCFGRFSVHHQQFFFFTVHTAKLYTIQVCWQLASRIRTQLRPDIYIYIYIYIYIWPPLWSSGLSFWLQIQRSRVRFPALPDFLSGSGSGTGYTQPREVNWGATWIK